MFKKRVSVVIIINMMLLLSSIAFAKITPKERENTTIITVKKGDTLWNLAEKYYNDPNKWSEFKKYNIFSDPYWIYPGEQLAISYQEGTSLTGGLKKRMSGLETERSKDEDMLAKKEAEMLALIEQYQKLSEIVAMKEEEISTLQQEVSQSKNEYKNELSVKDGKITHLFDKYNEGIDVIRQKEEDISRLQGRYEDVQRLLIEKEDELAQSRQKHEVDLEAKSQEYDELKAEYRGIIESKTKALEQLKQDYSDALTVEKDRLETLRTVIAEKKEDIQLLREDISLKDDEIGMLRNALFELRSKMVEMDSIISLQNYQINDLTTQRKKAINAGYFLGFALVSGIFAIEAIR